MIAEEPQTRSGLLRRLQGPLDDDAWVEFHRTYSPFLRRRLPPEMADDVVQDVMLAVLRSLPNYSAERGRFRAWLLGVLRNCLGNALRHRPREQLAGEIGLVLESVADDRDDFGHSMLREWRAFVARLALHRLRSNSRRPPADRVRAILELRYVRLLGPDAIMATLGCPRQDIDNAEFRWGHQLRRTILEIQTSWDRDRPTPHR